MSPVMQSVRQPQAIKTATSRQTNASAQSSPRYLISIIKYSHHITYTYRHLTLSHTPRIGERRVRSSMREKATFYAMLVLLCSVTLHLFHEPLQKCPTISNPLISCRPRAAVSALLLCFLAHVLFTSCYKSLRITIPITFRRLTLTLSKPITTSTVYLHECCSISSLFCY